MISYLTQFMCEETLHRRQETIHHKNRYLCLQAQVKHMNKQKRVKSLQFSTVSKLSFIIKSNVFKNKYQPIFWVQISNQIMHLSISSDQSHVRSAAQWERCSSVSWTFFNSKLDQRNSSSSSGQSVTQRVRIQMCWLKCISSKNHSSTRKYTHLADIHYAVGRKSDLSIHLPRWKVCLRILKAYNVRRCWLSASLSGRTHFYCIVEKWRGFERVLPNKTKLLQLWDALWAAQRNVKFVLVKGEASLPNHRPWNAEVRGGSANTAPVLAGGRVHLTRESVCQEGLQEVGEDW